jgi:hypothetical protein
MSAAEMCGKRWTGGPFKPAFGLSGAVLLLEKSSRRDEVTLPAVAKTR